MKRLITIILFLTAWISCSEDNNPMTPPEERHSTRSVAKGFPYLVFDGNENPIIIYGRDTGTQGIYDGAFDVMQFDKYSTNGEKIIDDKQILQTDAILDIAALYDETKDTITVLWLEPQNTTDSGSDENVQLLYKTLDAQGNILKDNTEFTHVLTTFESACNDTLLEGIYNGTMLDLKTETVFCDSLRDWIFIDSKENEHHLDIIGKHWDNMTQLTYSKQNAHGKILIEEKAVITNERLADAEWAPVFQNQYITIDSSNMIHSVWQLNDGKNNFYFYYLKLDNNGGILVYDKIGDKCDMTY